MPNQIPEMDFSHLFRTKDGKTGVDIAVLKARGLDEVGSLLVQHLNDDAEPLLLAYDGKIIATLLPGDRMPKPL